MSYYFKQGLKLNHLFGKGRGE